MLLAHNTCFSLLFQDVWWNKRSQQTKFFFTYSKQRRSLSFFHSTVSCPCRPLTPDVYFLTVLQQLVWVWLNTPCHCKSQRTKTAWVTKDSSFIPADLLASEVQKLSDKRRGQTQQLQFLRAKTGHRAVLAPDNELRARKWFYILTLPLGSRVVTAGVRTEKSAVRYPWSTAHLKIHRGRPSCRNWYLIN